jgi:hypothetical protein
MARKLSLQQHQIRRLRADARKLEAVARHLREEARMLAREDKAEHARAGFFVKTAKVDNQTVIEPMPIENLFEEEE